MARRRGRDEEEWDDDYDDDEAADADDADDRDLPDESDMDEHDEPDIVPCPACRKPISEDAERCHHCGHYVSASEHGSKASAIVILIVLALVLVAAVGWLVGR